MKNNSWIKNRSLLITAIPAVLALGVIAAILTVGSMGREPAAKTGTTPAVTAGSPTATQDTVTPSPEAVLPYAVSLSLTLGGEEIHSLDIEDAMQKQTVMDALFDYMIKSSAWPGVETSALQDHIEITIQVEEGVNETSLYHVFEKDGRHCMQIGDSLYSTISDIVYGPLHNLAMGYGLPDALTVTSGEGRIFALGHRISSEQKSDGLCADMRYLSPQAVADDLQYLEINTSSMQPFTPSINGKKVYGSYTLYDAQFNTVQFIKPSGLAPQTYIFSNAAPGKYIVQLVTSLDNEEETVGMQYLFGVNLPPKATETL